MKRRRWTDVQRCTACRACELVCSFHHRGVFQPAVASIRVERNAYDGTIHLSLDATCDRCEGEETPWCVRYCPREVLTPEQLGWGEDSEAFREEE